MDSDGLCGRGLPCRGYPCIQDLDSACQTILRQVRVDQSSQREYLLTSYARNGRVSMCIKVLVSRPSDRLMLPTWRAAACEAGQVLAMTA